jgi:hypothetical protein
MVVREKSESEGGGNIKEARFLKKASAFFTGFFIKG